MAKLTRQQLILFGQNGNVNNFEQFGSDVAGSSLKTKDIPTIQALSAWLNGWQDAIVTANKAPILEDMNAAFYVFCYQLSYLLQQGVAEWTAQQTYYQGSIVSRYGSTLELWVSLVDNNTANNLPVYPNDNSIWALVLPGRASALLGSVVAAQISSVNAGVILGQIITAQIADGAITTPKLAAGSVTRGALAGNVGDGTSITGGAGAPLSVIPSVLANYKTIVQNVDSPQVNVIGAGNTQTLLTLNQSGILLAMGVDVLNNPSSGSCTVSYTINVDGVDYTLPSFTDGIFVAGGRVIAGPISGGNYFSFDATTRGTYASVAIPFQTSLAIKINVVSFSDGRWSFRAKLVTARNS